MAISQTAPRDRLPGWLAQPEGKSARDFATCRTSRRGERFLRTCDLSRQTSAPVGQADGGRGALAASLTGTSTGSPVAAYAVIGLFAAGIATSLTSVGMLLQRFGGNLIREDS